MEGTRGKNKISTGSADQARGQSDQGQAKGEAHHEPDLAAPASSPEVNSNLNGAGKTSYADGFTPGAAYMPGVFPYGIAFYPVYFYGPYYYGLGTHPVWPVPGGFPGDVNITASGMMPSFIPFQTSGTGDKLTAGASGGTSGANSETPIGGSGRISLARQAAGRLGGAATAAKHNTGYYAEIGKRGGNKTVSEKGAEFYSEIGKKGGGKKRRRPSEG